LLGWKDLSLETIPIVTFFLFLKISANLIEFVFTMLGISTPEIISPSFFCDNALLAHRSHQVPTENRQVDSGAE
jgi:hypothetical protein